MPKSPVTLVRNTQLGLVQSLLRMAGLPWPVPDYSTVCRRQNSLNVQVHYRASEKGLHRCEAGGISRPGRSRVHVL